MSFGGFYFGPSRNPHSSPRTKGELIEDIRHLLTSLGKYTNIPGSSLKDDLVKLLNTSVHHFDDHFMYNYGPDITSLVSTVFAKPSSPLYRFESTGPTTSTKSTCDPKITPSHTGTAAFTGFPTTSLTTVTADAPSFDGFAGFPGFPTTTPTTTTPTFGSMFDHRTLPTATTVTRLTCPDSGASAGTTNNTYFPVFGSHPADWAKSGQALIPPASASAPAPLTGLSAFKRNPYNVGLEKNISHFIELLKKLDKLDDSPFYSIDGNPDNILNNMNDFNIIFNIKNIKCPVNIKIISPKFSSGHVSCQYPFYPPKIKLRIPTNYESTDGELSEMKNFYDVHDEWNPTFSIAKYMFYVYFAVMNDMNLKKYVIDTFNMTNLDVYLNAAKKYTVSDKTVDCVAKKQKLNEE